MKSKRRILLLALAATLLAAGGWLWYDEARGGRFARMAGSADPEDRLAAVAGLRGRGSGLARATLTDLATDVDPRVAAAAVRALGETGKLDDLRHVRRILTEGASGRARGAAAAVLAVHGGADVATLAATLLDDADPTARAAAALGFERRRDRAALPHLLKALADDDAGVRVRAISAINRIVVLRLPFEAHAPAAVRARQVATIRALLASAKMLDTPSTTRPSGGGEAE